MNNNELPQLLYRFYSSFDPKHLKILFSENTIHLSKPKTFNDPFDLNPNTYDFLNNPSLLRKFIEKNVRKNKDIPKKERPKFISNIVNVNKLSFLEKELTNIIQNRYIACFTDNHLNILMWAHYANSHHGFCVEFKTENLSNINIRKVRYSEQRPRFHPNKNESSSIDDIFLTKSIHWKYEQEYRAILKIDKSPFGDRATAPIPKNTIKSVYLGINTRPDDEQTLIKIIKSSRNTDIKLFKAVLHSHEFAIKFIPIKL